MADIKCELCGHKIQKDCHAATIYNGEQVYEGVTKKEVYLCHPTVPNEDHHDCYHLFTVHKARSKSEMRRIGKIIGK